MIIEFIDILFDSALEKIMYGIGKGLFMFFNLFRKNKADLRKISRRKITLIGYLFSILFILVTGYFAFTN